MAVEVREVNPLFVAEIGVVDLGRPIDRKMVDVIWQAIDRYAVLVFRDQHLDDTKLRDFAAKIGALEIGRSAGATAVGASRDRRHFEPRRRGAAASARRPAAASPNSPICAPPTMRCPRRRRPRSAGSSSSTTSSGRVVRSALPNFRRASASNIRRHGSGWRAVIPARSARRSTCRRTPRDIGATLDEAARGSSVSDRPDQGAVDERTQKVAVVKSPLGSHHHGDDDQLLDRVDPERGA